MSVTVNPSATDLFSAQMQEAVKTYSAYDGSNRIVGFYVAPVGARNGDQCQLTVYAYDGATTRVLKTKEILALWDATWDI